MTFPHARRHRGFTLVELLVVIGIIVLLAGLGLPMVLRAYKSGTKMRSQADLQTITTALNAYKQDFGEYPRVPVPNTGPAVLCMALVGPFGDGQIRDPNNPTAPPTLDSNDPPARGTRDILAGDCVSDSGGHVALVDNAGGAYTNVDEWAPLKPTDGLDGPGFRTRRGPGANGILGDFDDQFQGQSWGPYLPADKLNVRGAMFRDSAGRPILYFPASPGRPNIRGTVQAPPPGPAQQPGFVARSDLSKYDANDNLVFFKRAPGVPEEQNALNAIRGMLGDTGSGTPGNDCNGVIDPGETPATEDGFILWSAGPDGLFGPVRSNPSSPYKPTMSEIQKCDDVATFIR
jgi:prepilin-type N-terminal cleavage/methylation domain-containing protein